MFLNCYVIINISASEEVKQQINYQLFKDTFIVVFDSNVSGSVLNRCHTNTQLGIIIKQAGRRRYLETKSFGSFQKILARAHAAWRMTLKTRNK